MDPFTWIAAAPVRTQRSILLRNQLLATGQVITVLPEWVLQYYAKQWSLKALPIDLGVALRPVVMVTLKNRTVGPVVQLFTEQFRAVAQKHVRRHPAGR